MEINDIKQSLPILSVLRYFGIVPDKNGMISCPDPNHRDKHPSCKIYEKTNTFFCFSCGAKGDQIQLIEFLQGQGKHKAILTAKEILGHVPPMKNNKTHNTMDTLSPKQLKEILRLFFEKAATSYKKSANAKAYCKKRGIDGHKLGLGFVGVTFFRHYTDKQREMAIKAGLLKKHREGSYKSKFTNCIIFPLYNTDGEIIYIYGRSISGSDKFKHVLLGGSYIGIYPSFPGDNIKQIILTEGFGDCATLLTYFDKIPLENTAVIPLFSSVGGFTPEMKQAVSGRHIEEVIQFYDGDSAGKTALEKNTEIIKELNKTVRISAVDVPEGEDINSLLDGHSPEIYTGLINNRKTIVEPKLSVVRGDNKEQTNTSTQGQLNPAANGEAKKDSQNDETEETRSTFNTDNPRKLIFTTQTATYIIKGSLSKDFSYLKATLEIIPPKGKRTKSCRPDFYDDNALEKTAREAGEKLDLPTHLLEDDLYELKGHLENHRDEITKEQDTEETPKNKKLPVSPQEKETCLKFWKQKRLFRALNDFLGSCGIVGEERARMLVYCIATSAGMYKTLHGIIKASSGTGKTHVMTKICELLPPEIYIGLTTFSEKSFFHGGKYDFRDCTLSVEDRAIMSDEMKLYFREFQTKEWIKRRVSVPDKNGKFEAAFQEVIGPMATLCCTTEEEIQVDDENRCFIISLDESEEQKERIIEYRGKLAAGEIDKKTIKRNVEFMRNCIRMLKPYEVLNPYGKRLKLPPFVQDRVRLFDMFMGLIDQVALLHQFQCERDADGRLIATIEHVRLAVEVMFDAIVVKADDISDKVRKTFEKMKAFIKEQAGEKCQDYKFKVREVRLGTNIPKSTLNDHIRYLAEAEYLVKVGGKDATGNWYKIAHWDDYEGLRERIKNFMYKQIEELEREFNQSQNKEGGR